MERMSAACWEFVLELKKGRHSLGHTRDSITEMVNAMLLWGSPALGFIRKVSTSGSGLGNDPTPLIHSTGHRGSCFSELKLLLQG